MNGAANNPVAMAPHAPETPCIPNTSRASSYPRRGFNQDIAMGTVINVYGRNLGVSNINPDIANASAYPNPADNAITVRFVTSAPGTNVTFNVLDLTGKVIQSSYMGKLNSGDHLQDINLSNFATGMYMYSIATDNGTTFGRFIKQ